MNFFKTFGKNPSGAALENIRHSSNYHDGNFRILTETVMMAEKTSFIKLSWRFLNKPKNTIPPKPLPFIKTDLKLITNDKPVIIWFGHSSYFIRINQKNILVDPVFSGHASPFSFVAGSFPGTNIYTTEDLPDIDLLILTHDHYDHLDYQTVLKLKLKTKRIYTSLGVGSHLRYWGIDPAIITEFDWWDSKLLADTSTLRQAQSPIEFIAAPARHFSGRTFLRNKTLWSSFILKTSGYKIYIGGDSGYDAHFKNIGEKHGPFDIAMLEAGQYNIAWPQIHMMPEETVQAAIDLKAKILLPVHWGKFSISLHPWDEPIKRVTEKAQELNVRVTTPMIGEPVILNDSYPDKEWWIL
jgi:L-ascorbate metabolism protein UlaG (beta-lactamase superfamily)